MVITTEFTGPQITEANYKAGFPEYLLEAACFCARLLGIDRVSDVFVNIEFLVGSRYVDKYGAVGLCHPHNGSDILIQIADDGDWLVTLCHEMVHLRQEVRLDYHFCEDEADALEHALEAAVQYHLDTTFKTPRREP